MSPEHIIGNMWRLKKDERVTGRVTGGELTLYGPQIIRIHEFPDLGECGLLSVQGSTTIEVDGLNFAAHVETKQKE